MKYIYRFFVFAILLGVTAISSHAQQVNTLYFLENAPMRHTINPAFQPTGDMYLLFPAIGYTSFWIGNNSLSVSDLIFNDHTTGQTITALHPNAEGNLWKKIPTMVNLNADLSINIFGLGVRTKQNGFLHVNFTERMNAGVGMPKSIFEPILGEYKENIDLNSLNVSALLYSEIAIGYSRPINGKWSVGGKLKFLLGHASMVGKFKELSLTTSTEIVRLYGHGTAEMAGLLNAKNLESLFVNGSSIDPQSLLKDLIPSGFGGALDLGFTYKPIKHLQVTASITDLGAVYWNKGDRSSITIDTTFMGFENINMDYNNGGIQTDAMDSNLSGYLDALEFSKPVTSTFAQMLTPNVNIGIDANFWKNRVGVGIYSRTRFNRNYVSEEVTIGAVFRPWNCFNLATSYSILNGRGGNIGAALSIAPYDGLMFTIAADYLPLSYTSYKTETAVIPIPYKTGCVDLSFGIAIVTGTNKKRLSIDDDNDGVFDDFDMCLHTPLRARVDVVGCPVDADGDGVPDYIDQCPNTPAAAYGLIDSLGCPIDSDEDGIADYIDQCPNTIEEARNYVNEKGCVLDVDGDGVPDFMDFCPNTPAAAYDYINEDGCPIDSDGDGVYDYIDKCPDTPIEAQGRVDQYGCPLDMDRDGVYDYLDKCPNTPAIARNHVDEWGCTLDSDGDGVYDYEDLCPTISGSKSNSGCPEVSREVQRLLNKAKVEILFENGKSTLKSTSYAIIDQLAQIFIKNPSYRIEVQGHTDNIGNYQHNKELSERRAQVVREYLIKQGVPAQMIIAHGYGSDRPIASNDTKEGRDQNCRIEFNITFE